MRTCIITFCLLATLGGGDESTALAAGKPSKLDKQEAAARQKLQRAVQFPNVETKILVFNVRNRNLKKLANALDKKFRDRANFAAAAVPELGIVMVRADEKTLEEVDRFIDYFKFARQG